MKKSPVGDTGLEVSEQAPGVYILTHRLNPSPEDGGLYARRKADWEALPDGLHGEPPADGKAYLRKSGLWVAAPGIKVAEAPEDGARYVRGDGKWILADQPGIDDAPVDGKSYVRQAGRWVPVIEPKTAELAAPAQAEQKVDGPGATLRSDVDTLKVHAVGNVVLFDPKSPAISPGKRAGQTLILCGASGTVTIQGVSEYAHAGVVLAVPTRVLSLGVWLTLIWTGSVWLETAYLKQP